ncbi:hypothetical protein Sjap_010563 [Stephania japonica]|uniref:Peptidase M14 domain-containing protein n=1 Tax=Stephania japonica TaxID=461633 RepID=A0AAP0P786_9MAGN
MEFFSSSLYVLLLLFAVTSIRGYQLGRTVLANLMRFPVGACPRRLGRRLSLQIRPRWLPDLSIAEMARGYMTNSDLEDAMKQFITRCSHISRMYSIGKSVNGVPLWVMEISDKPGHREAEPAFKVSTLLDLQFIGNVHGDEPVGRELLLLLANWLCDNYRKDPLATLIITKVHLHMLPTMNPDGFSLRVRGNANYIDLNRDFPDQFLPMNNDEEARQPETKAIMRWLKEYHFTASASLHGGALVANYPWDGSQSKRREYYACPDDKAFQYMASLYSHSHYNMSLGKEFHEGITNGAAWYPIYGGMQDWNYIHGGCFELTLEISEVKWPDANELPALWEYNRISMLNLVASLVKTGVHGRILSSEDGRTLPASVAINGINYTVIADQAFGDYHRILAPGEKYEVMATVPGYQSKATRILLEDDEAVNVDFVMDPEGGPQTTKQLPVSINCNCNCDCDKTKIYLAGLEGWTHVEMSLVVAVILACFGILFKRKTLLKLLKQRPLLGPRRSVGV